MKLFHLADLHIGKKVNGYSMIDDQRFVLDQVIARIRAEQPGRIDPRRGYLRPPQSAGGSGRRFSMPSFRRLCSSWMCRCLPSAAITTAASGWDCQRHSGESRAASCRRIFLAVAEVCVSPTQTDRSMCI